MEIHPIIADVDEIYSPVEIVKDGSDPGDNDNWRFSIVGNNLQVQYKVGGVWKKSFVFTRQA